MRRRAARMRGAPVRGHGKTIERLLDPRTVGEMCAGEDVGARQRSAAEKWLKMLDGGLLEDGEKSRADFLRIVLVDLLGYDEGRIKRGDEPGDFACVGEGGTVACIGARGAPSKGLFMPTPGEGRERKAPVRQTWIRMARTGAEYGICTNYRDFVLIAKRFALTKYHAFDFLAVRDNPAALREFLGVFSMRSLEGGFPYAARARSAGADRRLADEFYELYSRTRLMLVREFADKGLARGEAVAAAQTFLNRLMFVFFAEDANLVKDGMFSGEIASILIGNVKTNTRRVWNYIARELFPAFENGQADPHITAFRGDLFREPLHASAFFPDKRKSEFFDELGRDPSRYNDLRECEPRIAKAARNTIGLNPVITHLLKLSSYDFQSQMRIDMLGHIFENSVADLDVLLGRRAATRRLEGIFYTPEYVTGYICTRTIVGYLSPSGTAQDLTELVDEYDGDLDGLHERMDGMAILDPACGSGAFLMGAARTLISIHEEIVRRKYGGDEKSACLDRSIDAGRISRIVRNSIYGIDTNPQSVDIARLSLYLLTAADGERLPDLSGNVVVGNSVAATPDRGGLDWEKAFPAVFAGENPGFSVIVGNPPYVRHELLAASAKHAMAALPGLAPLALPADFCIPKKSDLSAYFYYHSLARLRKRGRLGFISGDNWLRAEYGGPLRRMLLSNAQIEALVSPRFKVFPDADVNTVIVLLSRAPPDGGRRVMFANAASVSDFAAPSLDVAARVPQSAISGANWSLHFDGPVAKPPFFTTRLDLAGRLGRGMWTGCSDFFVLSRDAARARGIPPAYLRPVVTGGDLPRLEARHATAYILAVRDSKDELEKTARGRLVKKYIEDGEGMTALSKKGSEYVRVPLPEHPTAAKRNPWYSLPIKDPPAIFISRISDRAVKVYENGTGTLGQGRARERGKYRALDTYIHFTPAKKSRTGAFLAYLSSSYFALNMEKNAAPLGGGGLRIDNRMLAGARVPAFDELPLRVARRLDRAWSEYCETLDQKKLDEAVFTALGMEQQLDAVRAELDRLIDRRRRASKPDVEGSA